EGNKLKKELVQFHLKNDELNDPLLTPEEILELGIATQAELKVIKNKALLVNWLMKGLFEKAGLCLADFKLEYGFDENGEIILGDELSPDNMRLWELDSKESKPVKLDKDLFREGKEGVISAYEEVLKRISKVLEKATDFGSTPVTIQLNIFPQEGLLDPTGRTLKTATQQLGFKEVEKIKVGKILSIELNDYRMNMIEEMCERILVSPASEEFEYELSS
ncbi:MAG TPA: phosphoribosylformylglycinamidine synthase subunit PurS, partial [Vampirovibrionales bacterium]